jgi:hypothetical protein
MLLFLPIALACNRPPAYVGPAPAGALDCALREAIDLGYRRMEGRPGDSFARVSQRPDPAAEGAAEVNPRPGAGTRLDQEARPMENQLIFREEGGRLRVEVVSLAAGRAEDSTVPTADAHARRIFATCTTP